MPTGPIPDSHADLLEVRLLGQLATVDSGNRPQVNPVWFLWEDGHLLLSIKPETKKYRNLRGNPAVALSVLDPGNSFRYIELRGEAIDFELFTTLAFVNRLAHKYTGADFTGGVDGEERWQVTIRIDSWTSAGS